MYASPVVGILVEILLMRTYGVGSVLDVYRAVLTFMLMGQGLIASQLLKYVVIPKMATFRSQGKEKDGFLFALHFTLSILLVTLPLLFLGVLRPDIIIHYLAPGIPGEVTNQASWLVTVGCVGFFILTLVGSLTAIVNFYGVFWGQPVGQMLMNGGIGLAIFLAGHLTRTASTQFGLLAIALGVGLLLMVGILAWQTWMAWIKLPVQHASQRFWDTFRGLGWLLLPQLVILGTEMWKPILVNRELSQLDSGSLALYQFAFRLLMLGSLPAQAIATVLFPHISRIAAEADGHLLRKKLQEGTFVLGGISFGLSCGLFITAPFWMPILSSIAGIHGANYERLLSAFSILVWCCPSGALAMFYVQSAFACHRRWFVVGYGLFSTLLLTFVLSFVSDLNGVAFGYMGASWGSVIGFGIWFFIYSRYKMIRK